MAAFQTSYLDTWYCISRHDDLHLLYCRLQVAILTVRSSPPAIHYTLLRQREAWCHDKHIDGTCHAHGSVFTSRPIF